MSSQEAWMSLWLLSKRKTMHKTSYLSSLRKIMIIVPLKNKEEKKNKETTNGISIRFL